MLRLRLSSNFSFESFTVTWMCNTQEKGWKGIFINYIMYFLELFQGKYFRQIQSHQLYQMYSSWMISIKYTSPVIFFLKFLASAKGQLISECLFDVLNFPKDHRKNRQISALESKKWSNHKIKSHYNDFHTNYM